jgi:hypothetical protein
MIVLFAYAFGALVAVALVIRDPRNLAAVFPIVVTAASIAIVFVLLVLRQKAKIRRAITDVRQAESVVATGLIEAPRRDVAEVIGELRQLGFAMIGATDTSIAGRQAIRTWVLTDIAGPATTWIEVGIAGTAIAVFLSRASNGRFLETAFHRGDSIDNPDLLVRSVWTSIDDALREHRATLAEWELQSGPPLVVRTLGEYREVETELRDRTGGMRLSAYMERVVEASLRYWAVSAAIATVAVIVLILLPGP